jgi:TPR repeat protein
MKHLIQVINRANFGRYSTNRFLARTATRLEPLAQAGNGLAMYHLGMLHWDGWGIPQNRERGLELLRAAAEAGVPIAIYNLAVAYDNGFWPAAINRPKAFMLFVKAAKLGYKDAMHSVGDMLISGEGTTRNATKAKYWFLKAAKLGYATAMYDVACCYQNGTGTKQNTHLALRWFERALQAGETKALTGLGYCYHLLVSPPDIDLARSYYERASQLGHRHATYNLGLMAEKGLGQPALLPDAIFWYRRAAELGHEGASLKLAKLLGKEF